MGHDASSRGRKKRKKKKKEEEQKKKTKIGSGSCQATNRARRCGSPCEMHSAKFDLPAAQFPALPVLAQCQRTGNRVISCISSRRKRRRRLKWPDTLRISGGISVARCRFRRNQQPDVTISIICPNKLHALAAEATRGSISRLLQSRA